jgi:aldehyde:ferredoxin oxidoreductase
MGKLYGYAGKQLRVLLEKKETRTEDLDPAVVRKYLGGVGYAAKSLYDELQEGTDPLGPDNRIVFATSPLTRHDAPGGGSILLCCKSPLTNTWGESRCGGNFGPELRKAGYDFIVVEGKAKEPVYLVIRDENVEFRPARHLLGKIVSEKTKIIREELADPEISVMCIGPGGENMVRYATVMSEARAAGRCGIGAVMGSKNLLAVAVKGSGRVEAAHPEEFKNATREAMRVIRENPTTAGFKEDGTTGDMAGNDDLGDWPTKNWQANSWGKGQELYDYFRKHNLVGGDGCYRGCPVGCARIAKVEKGKFKTPEHEGAEYESISCFTAYLLNENMDAAVHSTWLCNEYGLDTISTGAVIAFAMECYEKGILKPEDVGDLDLSWGNAEVLPRLVEMIAKKQGIGKLLADGVKRAAERLGGEAKEFAIHGKGLEAPAHDPRSGKALAVTYGTANRGLCHIHPLEGMAYDSGKKDFGMVKYGVPDPNTVDRWDEKGKGRIVKILQDGLIAPDVLCTCKFMMYCGLTVDHYASMLSAATGWKIDGSELLRIGERVINLQRLFNVREGFTRADDSIPERMRQLPVFGKYKDEDRCAIRDYDGMLREYYEARGWDIEDGKPTEEKLQELGLERK